MISIKAENKGERTELAISIQGKGENILPEAVHIMEQLPKQIKETSRPLFLRFVAELMGDLYDIMAKTPTSDGEEDEDDND